MKYSLKLLAVFILTILLCLLAPIAFGIFYAIVSKVIACMVIGIGENYECKRINMADVVILSLIATIFLFQTILFLLIGFPICKILSHYGYRDFRWYLLVGLLVGFLQMFMLAIHEGVIINSLQIKNILGILLVTPIFFILFIAPSSLLFYKFDYYLKKFLNNVNQ